MEPMPRRRHTVLTSVASGEDFASEGQLEAETMEGACDA